MLASVYSRSQHAGTSRYGYAWSLVVERRRRSSQRERRSEDEEEEEGGAVVTRLRRCRTPWPQGDRSPLEYRLALLSVAWGEGEGGQLE